jgi:single-strand DNA-binding protein
MNRTILKGNLTREVELRYTPKGTAVGEFSIAVNRKWKDQQTNEMKEEVVFLECQAWSRQAEVIAQHFTKGSPILVEGRLAQNKWLDKETGKQRSKTLVVVEQFEFCGDARGGKAMPAPVSKPGVGNATGEESMGEVFGGEGDDITF